ncbi:MAG: hypothetical protein Kow0069_18870 [Promethearchaeota archaeon]
MGGDWAGDERSDPDVKRAARQGVIRLVELVGFLATGVSVALFVAHLASNTPTSLNAVFWNPFFVAIVVAALTSVVAHSWRWKLSLDYFYEHVVHAVAHRGETPVAALAEHYCLPRGVVLSVLERLVKTGDLQGEVRGGIFHSHLTSRPRCPSCGSALSPQDRYLTCPRCRRAFHKRCILDHLADDDHCPACGKRVHLSDLFQ